MQSLNYDTFYPIGEESELLPREITNIEQREELILHYLDNVTVRGETYKWVVSERVDMDVFATADPRVTILMSDFNHLLSNNVDGKLILTKNNDGMYVFQLWENGENRAEHTMASGSQKFIVSVPMFCGDATVNEMGQYAFEGVNYFESGQNEANIASESESSQSDASDYEW